MNPNELVPVGATPEKTEKEPDIAERLAALRSKVNKNKEIETAWESEAKKLADEVVEMEEGNKKLIGQIMSREDRNEMGTGFFSKNLSDRVQIKSDLDGISTRVKNDINAIETSISEAESLGKQSDDESLKAECDAIISDAKAQIEKIKSESEEKRALLQSQLAENDKQYLKIGEDYKGFDDVQSKVSLTSEGRTEHAIDTVLNSHSLTEEGEMNPEKFTPAQKKRVAELAKEKINGKEDAIRNIKRINEELPEVEKSINTLEREISEANESLKDAGKEIEEWSNIVYQDINEARTKLENLKEIIDKNSKKNRGFWTSNKTADKAIADATKKQEELFKFLRSRNEESLSYPMKFIAGVRDLLFSNKIDLNDLAIEVEDFAKKEEFITKTLEQDPSSFKMPNEKVRNIVKRSKTNFKSQIRNLVSDNNGILREVQRRYTERSNSITALEDIK